MCPCSTLATENPAWTVLGFNPVPCCENPTSARLNYGTVFILNKMKIRVNYRPSFGILI
jgi:hypothetical protein